MRPADLELIVRDVRTKRKSIEAGGLSDLYLAPLICTMLETLLQHEADKECLRIAAGGRPTR